MTLYELRIGEKGKIISILEDSMSLKLMEMGFIPNAEVSVEHHAAGDDPIAVRVSGYLVGLRATEAMTIMIEKI